MWLKYKISIICSGIETTLYAAINEKFSNMDAHTYMQTHEVLTVNKNKIE